MVDIPGEQAMANVPIDLLSQVLGLMTPDQIKELSRFTITEKTLSLTQVLLNELEGVEENVVGQKKEEASVEQVALNQPPPSEQSGENAEDNSVLESERKIATSLFLIMERKYLEKTQKKIHQAEIIKLYRTNLAVNIEQERLNKEDLSKSHNLGVLINKKQS